MYSRVFKSPTGVPSVFVRRFVVTKPVSLLGSKDGVKEDLTTRPDTLATTSSEYNDFKRVLNSTKFEATWINALKERNKQLERGKVIDSYMYSKVKSAPIIEKTREESFAYITLPFKSNPMIADFYVNAGGRIRMGQLFQDLDSLAGKIAYNHTAPVEPMIVTASVDRIYLLKHLEDISDVNILISGSVIFTGRSSMEIAITARYSKEDFPKKIKESDLNVNDENIFLTASFTFVARDPETHKSMAINKLLPLSESQWKDFQKAESRIAAKKLGATQTNLATVPPTEEENKIIHQLWSSYRKLLKLKNKPSNIISMNSTELKSTMFMQPQYRNRHSYMIFGGYLMRQTFELAYCAAAAFSHSLPRFVSLDSTTFKTPVPVGSILHMKATVVYTTQLHPNKLNKEKDEVDAEEFAEEIQKIGKLPKSVTPSQLPGMSELLKQPGTLVQVKVGTWVQELHSTSKNKLQKSGNFIFSFFVASDSENNADLSSSPDCDLALAARRELSRGKVMMVMPETYDDMIQYIKARRRVIETTKYVSSMKV